ncbi:SGNH hydrolase-type esterase domain-containing protein [Kockiozyma suomiensis]|uniref:SGNH hydrolase-type esterase domain-containing protein n=1 Tax=Kockiozyma suomiensis TaxID=1337062 RepID=UPI003343ABF7
MIKSFSFLIVIIAAILFNINSFSSICSADLRQISNLISIKLNLHFSRGPVHPDKPDQIMAAISHYKKVILFGDSQFETSWRQDRGFAFAAGLANYYTRRADVLNRGLSGYNTKWMQSQFNRILEELDRGHPDDLLLFIMWVGTNDCCIEGTPHHIPVEQFQANMRQYVSVIQSKYPRAGILLVTPAPVSLSKMRLSSLRTKGADRTQAAHKTYSEAVLSCKFDNDNGSIKVINLFDAVMNAAGYSNTSDPSTLDKSALVDEKQQIGKFTADGLHLNGEGYKLLYTLVTKVLNEWQGFNPTSMEGVEPGWQSKVTKSS